MFLIEPSDLSVHEVAKEQIEAVRGGEVHSSLDMKKAGILSGIFIGDRFPLSCVEHETLTFVKLDKDRGWVWASTCKVRNRSHMSGDCGFPIDAASLGDDFLFLWPAAVAIHVYVNIKEKRRRDSFYRNSRFYTHLMDHPPCVSYLPDTRKLPGYLELPTVRRVTAKQLTVAQRLFVASLRRNAAPFERRKLTDEWCAKLDARDRAQFEAWCASQRHRLSVPPRVDLDEAAERVLARSRPPKRSRRNGKEACHLLNLPDDLLERIISVRVSECLHDVGELRAIVPGLIAVSAQFRRATFSVIDHMLERVARAAASLLTNNPREPLEVQAITQAAGLSLQHALRIVPGDWPYYLRLRKQWSVVGTESNRHRRELLWCHE